MLDIVYQYMCLAMGDDSLGRQVPDNPQAYVDHMAGLGIQVTGANKDDLPGPANRRAVDFTSHLYDLDSDAMPVFNNQLKLSWRLALMGDKELKCDQAVGVLFVCRHNLDFMPYIRKMLGRFNPEFACIRFKEGMGFETLSFL